MRKLNIKAVQSTIITDRPLNSTSLNITDVSLKPVEMDNLESYCDDPCRLEYLLGDGVCHPFALEETITLMEELAHPLRQFDPRAIIFYGELLELAGRIMKSKGGHDEEVRKAFKERVICDLAPLGRLLKQQMTSSERISNILKFSDTNFGTTLLPPPSGTK